MYEKNIIENLIQLLPYWHYKVERPLKQSQRHPSISYEAYYCLAALYRKGSMSMSELCKALHVSKQQGTQIIDKLYARHLVKRSFDTQDRRIIRIDISLEGSTFLKEQQINADDVLQQFTLPLNVDEAGRLREATQVLLELLPKLP